MPQDTLKTIAKSVKYWWAMVLLGVGLCILAVVVLRNPGGTLAGLAFIFSSVLLFSAAMSAIFALTNREVLDGWGWTLAVSIFEILLAIVLLNNPGIALIAITFVVGIWVMFRGVYLISLAFELRDYRDSNWGWTLAGGIVTTLLALSIFIKPLVGAMAVAIWIGTALILAGIIHIAIGLVMRNVKRRVRNASKKLKEAAIDAISQ